jgi:hypothetical protein
MLRRLIAEARRGRATARRGGGGSAVPQRNARGRLGPVARQFLTSAQTVQFVSAVSGFRAAPALEASCYTYYDEANHFCGVHRDRPDACVVTLLVCLAATFDGDVASPGLSLSIFGPRYRKGQRARVRLTSIANNMIVLRGSKLFHSRARLAPGERTTILTACYRQAK